MKNPLSIEDKLAVAVSALEFYTQHDLSTVTDKKARDALRVIKEGYAIGGLVTNNRNYLVGENANPFPAILLNKMFGKTEHHDR